MGAWRSWVGVNGGVLLVATLVQCSSYLVRAATGSPVAAAVACTAVLYVLAYALASGNLRGRPRTVRERGQTRSIALWSIAAHPIGSACERLIHEAHLAGGGAAGIGEALVSTGLLGATRPLLAASGTACALVGAASVWWILLTLRLFAFEIAFDGLFYFAHRACHAHPLVYRLVHKLHHRHTHDVSLISALQMGPLDVIATHTLPVLGALWLVPLAPGIELSIAKTYLLFQEFYGHAGVEHRGRNFGPAPGVARALGIELRAEDHQRHHISAHVNFSKRFSLFDRLFGTWDGAGCAGQSRAD